MAVADITVDDLISRLRQDPDDDVIYKQIERYRASAIAYMRSYTGQNMDYINEHDEFDSVLEALVIEQMDNPAFTTDNDKENRFIQYILNMHRGNLV